MKDLQKYSIKRDTIEKNQKLISYRIINLFVKLNKLLFSFVLCHLSLFVTDTPEAN